MPTLHYDDDELGLHPGWDEGLDPNIRKELRQARVIQRENADLKGKVETYERERVLTRAGIPSDKRGELFARTYEGALDDPEAVKAAYEELFGSAGAAPAGDPDPAAGDRRVAAAGAAGDSQGTPGTVDLADAIKGAKTVAEVKAIIAAAPPEAGIRLAED